LEFNVFNSWRLQTVVDHYLKTGLIMDVHEANKLEPVWPTPGKTICHKSTEVSF
jgi:hypothetical protein